MEAKSSQLGGIGILLVSIYLLVFGGILGSYSSTALDPILAYGSVPVMLIGLVFAWGFAGR
ncbi:MULTISPECIES: hypothetical protein [unclassified Haladaptatus]|uniref:hypothetical protein n=1 Tax=unclassified Haladaptatus TaxID=2622732 RepID=UPI00209C391F|nr:MULTISPECIES: hypothetical protein [unclassified Haladaptatus]MCO8243851.1 hypothetical protein [Haladaptatus sp. AB643]MCO8253465.1 hypothetical protein [Haladaptatus sp. AB618]